MKRYLLFFIMLISPVAVWSQVAGDYRSIATGNWSALATWETYNGAAWVAAGTAPVTASNVITIRSPHVVTITAAVAGGIDQVVVDAGGTLNTSAAIAQSFANGVGVDILINGTFGDLSTASITFTGAATWQMGANGTLLKTTGSSSNNWQNAYQGGIATIPATANWIIRKIGAQQPALSTTSPGTGSVYPNLFIENNTAAAWTTPAGSSFTGAATTATVKGNLDIGGSGTNTVDFQSNNTFASGVLVQGNLTIRAGCNFRNFGTGIDVQGNITATGSMTYDANDGRQLIFSGSNNQTVNGAGAMAIYTMVLNKTGGTVTLNRAITVDNLATFTNGVLITTSVNLLTIASAATVGGANNSSFVSGPIRYNGSAAFTFPVGKGADYQPLAISASSSSTIWTENFNNGCSASCLGTSYVGGNGAWTQTILGAEGADPNLWYVSCAENGHTNGVCGTGCVAASATATLATMHVGSNPNSLGDLGAAYDAGGLCGIFTCPQTNRRIESPSINLTGYTNVVVSFNYIENGATTIDNATLWYFDGATWSQLDDMPKSTLCSGQGTWASRTIALPSSANNNPNIKVGFLWVNNDDGAGTDPSFAVDDVTIGILNDPFVCEYFFANPQVTFNNVLAPTLNHISQCEYWVLNRVGTSTSKDVTLSWDANSCGVTNMPDLRVARWDGAVWQDHGNGGTTGSNAAGTVITSAPVTAFSPFTLASVSLANPLPIELVSFSAACEQDQVVLRWKTASEQNNQFFAVERSTDGMSFTEIARVSGSGNSDSPIAYSWIDLHPASGYAYYRLRQIDFNGQDSYSTPVLLESSDCSGTIFHVTQTLFSESNLSIQFDHAANDVDVYVYDVAGRLLANASALKNQQTIELTSVTGWPTGVYLIRITDGYSTIVRRVIR
ncbi:MAG: T9SS type A sorting domain-containing protein [Bacteroidia bacterium]